MRTYVPYMPAARRLILALGVLLAAAPVCGQELVTLVQTCDAGRPSVTSRFENDTAGTTVVDRKTGLRWMRCALGQRWDGAACAGVPFTSTWAEGFDHATDLNRRGGHAGHADWRVPTLDELASLVEPHCYDPAIDLASFPSSPITGFWTVTPHVSGNHAMLVHFKYGGIYMGNKNQVWALRLVRD
ncbi:MAG: DUF1566 domain-containing protein [Gammaproteobacteria bacterium]|nr:DUF1566 domain-containing protein [Gammaproteobacteria bacterium]